jgi:heme-degrading monooxygenase HmoA
MSDSPTEFPADTPRPPYYAVIFSSIRTADDDAGYAVTADRMLNLARRQPGFLGVESVRDADRNGITVSYWESREAIHRWGREMEHRAAQAGGREKWYAAFRLRIVAVEAETVFTRRAAESAASAAGPTNRPS